MVLHSRQKIITAASAIALACAFLLSVFYGGTDSVLYAPAFICLLVFSGLNVFSAAKAERGVLHIPCNALTALVALFGVYTAASILWAPAPYLSTIFASIICVLPFLFFVLTVTPRARVYGWLFGAIIAVIGVWALIQFFFFYNPQDERIHHPMLNPSDLAVLLCMAMIPAAGLFLFISDRVRSAALFVVFAVLYGGLIVTQSRGALLAGLGSIIILLPFAHKHWMRLAALIAVIVALPYALSGDGGVLKDLENLPIIMETTSTSDRLMLWSSTWQMIKDHMWAGVGLGAFYFNYPRYRVPADGSDGFFVHMDPLQFWAEMGVAAPIIFYAVLIAVLWRTVKAVMRKDASREQKFAVMLLFCAMLAPIINTHISFHLYMPGLIIPLALLLALWYVATEDILGTADRRYFNLKAPLGKTALAVACIVCVLTAGWLVRWSAAVYYIRDVQTVIVKPGNHLAEAQTIMDRVGKIAPPSYSKYPEYEARAIVARLWGNAEDMPISEVQTLYKKGMEYITRAEKLNPAYTGVWDLRARLNYAAHGIAVADGRERAEAELRRVAAANPLSVDARLGLANILKAKGDMEGAGKVLEDGLQWPRQRGQQDIALLFAAAQVRLVRGDRAGHDKLANEAIARAKHYGLIPKDQKSD